MQPNSEPTNHTPDPFHDAEAYERTPLDTAGAPVPDDANGAGEPDEQLDAAYEARHEESYSPAEIAELESMEARGWPGDGSGEDDLADLMARGDEGCCDGPGD